MAKKNMKLKIKNNAFSLTEVLMAAGILCIGIMLVATMFPVAIYLTTVASERTMASIVADEAFAKMQLYGMNVESGDQDTFTVYSWRMEDEIDEIEFTYPSVDPQGGCRQYSWAAVCKKLNNDSGDMRYLVKLYVARKTSPNQKFYASALLSDANTLDWPVPIPITVAKNASNELLMKWNKNGVEEYINPPPSTSIIDCASGRIFRIIGRDDKFLTLDRDWDKDLKDPCAVLFLPAGIGSDKKPSGRNPDIDIFQKIIDFRKN